MPSGIYKRTKKYKEQCKKRAVKEGIVKYLGDGMLGKHHTESTIEKIKKGNRGKKILGETKKKIGKKLKGNIPWNKNKKGLQTAWNKGISRSIETKKKIGAAQSEKWLVIFPSGERKIVKGLRQFCRKYNLNCGCMHGVAYGTHGRSQHKGFKVERL